MLGILSVRKFGLRFKVIQQLSTFALLFAVSLSGCGETEKAPDVSHIKIELQASRFDKDLATLDTNNLGAELQRLHQKYPDFLNFFLDTLMGFGIQSSYSENNPAVQTIFRRYLTHKDYRGLFDTVAKHYPDTRETDEQLTKGFQYMKHYFPAFNPPKVIYMITWLNNWGAITYGNTVGIGLDMFLEPSYPFYKSVNVPEYMGIKLRKEYIPVAVFRAIYQDRVPFVMEEKTLLDMMIQRGKELYFLSKVLPFVPEHDRPAYTKEQLEWCEDNEAQVYNFFVTENLLYETNWQKILRYVNDGPTSTGMPSESPGNIGSWIGYEIVKAYMERYPDKTLQQLIEEKTDAQRFLHESRYKPK